MPHILKADKIVGQWGVPIYGITRNRPIVSIPEGALYDGLNVIVREGLMQVRPGMNEFVSGGLTGRPTGSFGFGGLAQGAFEPTAFDNSSFQMASNLNATNLIVGTTRKLYAYFAGILNDITDTTLTALDVQLARFTSIYINSTTTLWVLHCNGVDTIRQWNTTSSTFSVTSGSPPAAAFDMCTVADHVILAIAPYTVRWCNNQDITTWPALNLLTFADTPDPIVCVKAIGVLGGVVLKTHSIWALLPSGDVSSEATFFRKELRYEIDGPAGTAACVSVNGLLIWMTTDGQVAAFDGGSVTWVAEGIKPLIQADLDEEFVNRIFGVVEHKRKEVWFFYPRVGDNGDCKGIAIVRLPDPLNDAPDFSAWMGRTLLPLSAGTDLRLTTRNAIVFETDGKSRSIDSNAGGDDAGSVISGYWQTGMAMGPGLEIYDMEAFEVFCQRDSTYGSLQVAPVSTYGFTNQGGTIGTYKTIDLTQTKVFEPKSNSNVKGRAFGLRGTFSTPVVMKYIGARLAADATKG